MSLAVHGSGTSNSQGSVTSSAGSVLLLVTVVVGVIARIFLAPQFDGLDDAGYLDAAGRVARRASLEGVFPLFHLRAAMVQPLGWLMRLHIVVPTQFWMLTFGAEIVALASLYIAGYRIAGRRVGLLAASLYAVYPLAVQQATMFYPTAFQVASITAALALLFEGELRSGPTGAILAGSGGTILGFGYLAKEDVAVVVPALVIASFVSRVPRPLRVTAFCAGAGIVFALECALYWRTTGHPLFRLLGTSGLGAPVAQLADIWRWDAYLRSLLLIPYQVGLFWWGAIPAFVIGLRSRNNYVRLVEIIFMLLLLYLQFGSGSVRSYSALPKTPRYTAIITPFLILSLAFALDRLSRHSTRQAAIVLATLWLTSIPCVLYLSLASSERTRNTLSAVEVLRRLQPSVLYTDFYSARVLRLFVPPGQPEIRVWYHADFADNQMQVLSQPKGPGAFVLLDHQAAKVYTSSYRLALPPSVTPAPDWVPIWSHEAYPVGTFGRNVLEWTRVVIAKVWPSRIGGRVSANVADMLDDDAAVLFRIGPTPTRGGVE